MCEITKENDSLQRQTENKDEDSHVPPIKKNVPELRFPEFEGEWKEVQIKDIANIVGGGTPSTKNKDFWNGKINWFTPTEVGENKYLFNSERKITEKGLEKSSATLLPINTILLTTRATIGRRSIILKKSTTNQGFQSLTIKNNSNVEFIYYLLDILEKILLRKSCGSTFLELSKKELKKINIIIPIIEEQEKIADFLSAIDKKIELMEKKHTLYQSIKKYILSNIFPVNNKKPSLRFKEFKNERKLFKLNEILSYSSSKHSLNKLEDNIGKYGLYGAEGVVKYVNFFDMDKEYISIIKDGAGVCRLHLCKPYSSIVGTMGYLTLKNTNYNLKYIYYQLLTLNLKKYIIGTTIPHIYFKDYSKEYILLPNLIEQGKIANLMLLLDTKIMKIQKQIDNLKKFKKGLLQKMFC